MISRGKRLNKFLEDTKYIEDGYLSHPFSDHFKIYFRGTWLAHSVWYATPDLRVASSCPTIGTGLTLKKRKKEVSYVLGIILGTRDKALCTDSQLLVCLYSNWKEETDKK